jgi:hypothetical protein
MKFDDIIFTILTYAAIGLLITGCPLVRSVVPGSQCTPRETRCYADNIETCGTDNRWRIETRCPERKKGQVCLDTDGETRCGEVEK